MTGAAETEPARKGERRPFCAAASGARNEPLTATASRIDHWILVEYRGAWSRDLLGGSLLSPRLKAHLREQLAALRPSRLLFVKRPDRRTATGRKVYLATSKPGAERLLGLEVEHQDDLHEVDLAGALSAGTASVAAPFSELDEQLLVVCTHGKRDRCCAREGRPLFDAIRDAEPLGGAWQSTHVGGDRFAGNVVSLPHGTYHGRVEPADVPGLLAALAAGRVDLDRYRGRSAYPFAVQAAERALRESEGLLGLDELVLTGSVRKAPDAWRVRFRTPDGASHALDVHAEAAEDAALLTCDALEPRRPLRYGVTAHRVRGRGRR